MNDIAKQNAVTLSSTAIQHFADIAPGKIVRFGLTGGGCAGFQYNWEILDNKDDLHNNDEVIDYQDFIFVIDGVGLIFLIGSTIDYLTDITGSHIEVNNPQATSGCGCGVSVSFN